DDGTTSTDEEIKHATRGRLLLTKKSNSRRRNDFDRRRIRTADEDFGKPMKKSNSPQ
ncbi:hypothetical protein BVRB_018340, partial [Beta vulgaris subsp. vulgaris]